MHNATLAAVAARAHREGSMFSKKETALTRAGAADPFGMLRQMSKDFDRMFEEGAFRMPFFKKLAKTGWTPGIDVFEKDNALVTKVDLPGMKKQDITVEIADGYLTISGERKTEAEEKKDDYYRCEREYGSFYRSVPLPEGAKAEDIKATFADGVLEVAVPLPPKAVAKPQTVKIDEPAKAAKTAA
jgi:HSP20 family protein